MKRKIIGTNPAVKPVTDLRVGAGLNPVQPGVQNTAAAIQQTSQQTSQPKMASQQAASGAVYSPKAAAVNNTATQQQSQQRPGVSQQTAEALAGYESGYQPSAAVQQAQAYLDQLLGQKPGEYQSPYAQQLADLYAQISGRQPFSYDLNGDALYQQYKDQYQRMGQQAMADTMGQAAGLTGGYGSSYSQNAGQQAYNAYLQQLNDRVPELYQLALNKYQTEGDELYKQYGLLSDRENQEYSRYRDTVGDWRNDLSFAYSQFSDARNFDADQWRTMLSYWQQKAQQENEDYWQQTQWDYQLDRDRIADERYDAEWQHQLDRERIGDERYDTEWQHQLDRERVGDSQWERQFAYQQQRDSISDSQWERQFAAAQSARTAQEKYDALLEMYNELVDSQNEDEEQDYYFKEPVRIHGSPLNSVRAVQEYVDKHSSSWSYDEWNRVRNQLAPYGIDIGPYMGKRPNKPTQGGQNQNQ